MTFSEYASHDATGLAGLVARKETSAAELARMALSAIEAMNPKINAVVEIYADEIERIEKGPAPTGPLAGVPFLIKDVFGHEAGRIIEFGSRLCRGMKVEASTAFLRNLKAAGLSIIGRSAAPEYSMAATTEA